MLRHTDNLSKTLQNTQMSAAEGQRLAAMTVATVKSTRNEEAFRLFWEKTLTESASLDIGQPTVPRKRKLPISQCTVSEVKQSETLAIHHYRSIYYETIYRGYALDVRYTSYDVIEWQEMVPLRTVE